VTSSNEKENKSRRYAEDPEYRKRINEGRRKPEYRKKINEGRRKRYAEDPEYREMRLARNRRRDVLSPADYQIMMARQGGVCAICLRQPAKRLCVDHCHATGKIRGLLCRACNGALGFLRDDENVAMAAATYLRKASAS
jgi:hypothetical protein